MPQTVTELCFCAFEGLQPIQQYMWRIVNTFVRKMVKHKSETNKKYTTGVAATYTMFCQLNKKKHVYKFCDILHGGAVWGLSYFNTKK